MNAIRHAMVLGGLCLTACSPNLDYQFKTDAGTDIDGVENGAGDGPSGDGDGASGDGDTTPGDGGGAPGDGDGDTTPGAGDGDGNADVPPPPECEQDSDCDSGWACIDTACRFQPPERMPTTTVQTLGGGTSRGDGQQLRLRIGAPQPQGRMRGDGNILTLGPLPTHP